MGSVKWLIQVDRASEKRDGEWVLKATHGRLHTRSVQNVSSFLSCNSKRGVFVLISAPVSWKSFFESLTSHLSGSEIRVFVEWPWTSPSEQYQKNGKEADEQKRKSAVGLPKPPHEETLALEAPPSLGKVEWEYIQWVLAGAGGNITQAARWLGIHRRSLQRKLRKYPPVR
jgi:DNA-binding NtrC family response regulator